jgi:hypothetical protein
MCGIVGYTGPREAGPILIEGLQRLEYRGYDSAGIALREDSGLDYVRAVGNLQNLVDAAGPNGSTARHGLGHTRWATHGSVTELNAHPLTGCDAGKLAIVLNGIVENYRELRSSLLADGHTFTSETDAEVVVHMLEHEYEGDLVQAFMRVYPQLEGHFTIVAIHHDQPDLLVGVRNQTPLVVGLGAGENFLAHGVFDGWQLSGVTTIQSGTRGGFGYQFSSPPFNDMTGLGSTGTVTYTPVLTCDPFLPKNERTTDRQFKTECITFGGPKNLAGDSFYQGNAIGDEWVGLGYMNHDITLFKNFALSGRRTLRFQTELYNAFNTTQYSGVGTTATFNFNTGAQTSTNFGKITSVRGSSNRVIQLGARFSF